MRVRGRTVLTFPTAAPDSRLRSAADRLNRKTMEETEVLNYVKAAALAVGVPLTDARAQAVALHLGRSVAMARLLEQAPLAPADEPAEVYRPAPFPQEDPA
jgi:hypothetical protein